MCEAHRIPSAMGRYRAVAYAASLLMVLVAGGCAQDRPPHPERVSAPVHLPAAPAPVSERPATPEDVLRGLESAVAAGDFAAAGEVFAPGYRARLLEARTQDGEAAVMDALRAGLSVLPPPGPYTVVTVDAGSGARWERTVASWPEARAMYADAPGGAEIVYRTLHFVRAGDSWRLRHW